ncbi:MULTISPECIES: DUF3139 domain-containing protein [Lactobacillus]|uniref:DUF3139 domain-containing protein n=1 Tax=Lactobacillus xujianguonis TaxID=2495899 RepID=A0A437SUA3_9LACO|nr:MULTISPECIES: DUF3139 domain-containing protein [Lactobacillus]RVU70495.1 hypothetical protein EJK17_07330 [Lactobacillus xujianguonis]RVU76835.1 hypothetical protein EJK20_03375 [Lactobacillus xujianguonis]
MSKFKQILVIVLVLLFAIFLFWRIRVNNQKAYANGAIQEYARMQGVPDQDVRKLSVSWNMKDNFWEALIDIKIDGKPYQLEYGISTNDVKAKRPEIFYYASKKEGEGWGGLSDSALKKFKYHELYNYRQ